MKTCILILLATITTQRMVIAQTKTKSTPYESYMTEVVEELKTLNGKTDMNRVRILMYEGRSFKYKRVTDYIPKAADLTHRERQGDCKDKALWLISRMNDPRVRYVIGKTNMKSKMAHAWVEWNDGQNWWILDCTLKYEPMLKSNSGYTSFYSYSKYEKLNWKIESPIADFSE